MKRFPMVLIIVAGLPLAGCAGAGACAGDPPGSSAYATCQQQQSARENERLNHERDLEARTRL
jgi:hypothetical protein